MKKHELRAIHTAISVVWGKASKCELCNGANKSKRFEWSNKEHNYQLEREGWWELCATCHRRYDRKKFGFKTWNKGLRKDRPTMICEWCGNPFLQKRKEQILCSQSCVSYRNGNIKKRKKGYLLENKLITP